MANYELNVKINGVEQSVNTIGELEAALKATNDELSKTEANSKSFDQLTRQAQNIENYLGVLTADAQTFNTQLKSVTQTTNTLGQTFQQTADAAEQLGNANTLNNFNQQVNQSVNSTDSLRTQLRQVVQELQTLEPGSARFQELSVRAGELRDTIGDTNNVVTALAGNATERLGTALSGVVNVGITGLQGVTGAMKLFGVESEESRQVLEKLQGLLFVTQAIQGFGALPDSIAAIRAGLSSLTSARAADLAVQEAQIAADAAQSTTTVINTAAQGASTVATEAHAAASAADATATGAATVATEGFTAALAANPIGLVVVGLTALISALIIFSDGQKTAKSNIDETTNSMLDQANQMKQQQDDFIALYKLRKEVDILQEKDATKRAEMTMALEEEILGLQQKSLEEQTGRAIDANAKLLDEFAKYKEAYIGERQVLVREVAQYDEFGVFIGMEQQYRTERFKIGEGTLNDLRDRLSKERKEIQADVDSKKLTADEGRIKEEQATTRFYIDYLTKQKSFLAQSSQAQDENLMSNLDKLIQSFQKTRTLLEKALAEQIRIQEEAEKKKAEDQAKADEEARRKREAALEKAKADYKRAYDDIVKTVKDANKELNDIETNNLQAIEKLRLDQTKTIVDNLDFELKLEQDKVNEVAKLALEQLRQSVLFNKKKGQLTKEGAKAEQDINTNLQEALLQLNTLYAEKRRVAIEEEVKLEQQKADKLVEINKILNNEISFGDQSVTDTKQSLRLRERELELQQLDFNFQNQQQTLQSTTEYWNKRKELLTTAVDGEKSILDAQRESELLAAQADADKRLANFADLLEKEFGIAEVERQKLYASEREALDAQLASNAISREEYLQLVASLDQKYRDDLTNKNLKVAEDEFTNQKALLKRQLDDKVITQQQYDKQLENLTTDYNKRVTKITEDGAKDSAQAYYKTKVNNEEEVAVRRKEINQKYDQEAVAASEKTEQEILNARIAALDKWAKFAVETLQTVLGLFQAISDLQKTELDNQLIDLKLYNEQRQNEINTQFNNEVAALQTQLQQGLISQEQYNAAVNNLDQQRTANSEKLAEAQRKKELEIKKKSFEDDKKLKIASAIISGIQGAVSAFTGAFTSIPNPIAAAVVGGIMAALVAATTAVQVAAISKQKFDSSGSAAITQPVSTAPPSAAGSPVNQASGGGFTGFNENLMGTPGGGTGTTGFTSPGQRVYVLESDITGTQDRVRVLESNSTFG